MTAPKRLSQAEMDAIEEKEALRKLQARRGKPVRTTAEPVSRTVIKDILPLMKDYGATAGALEANWQEIVGPRLANVTRPVKITRGKTGRVLVIEAPSAAAPMIQHQSGLIIERAKLGGAGDIKAIKIQQTKTKPSAAKATSKNKRARTLSEDERVQLDSGLAEIESTDLRAALAKLGEAILTRR